MGDLSLLPFVRVGQFCSHPRSLCRSGTHGQSPSGTSPLRNPASLTMPMAQPLRSVLYLWTFKNRFRNTIFGHLYKKVGKTSACHTDEVNNCHSCPVCLLLSFCWSSRRYSCHCSVNHECFHHQSPRKSIRSPFPFIRSRPFALWFYRLQMNAKKHDSDI